MEDFIPLKGTTVAHVSVFYKYRRGRPGQTDIKHACIDMRRVESIFWPADDRDPGCFVQLIDGNDPIHVALEYPQFCSHMHTCLVEGIRFEQGLWR